MIHQDVHKSVMQSHFKYKAYYDKKVNASKLKEAGYVYVSQPKADHQRSKILFTAFRWIGPYIIEKVLPNNKYLVSKIGTNKTQVLSRMRLRQFTSLQLPADIRITPRETKLDPEVSPKRDDLYARAWEWEYEKPIFDADNNNIRPPKSTENPVQSDISAEEMRNTPGTAHECFPDVFPQTEELSEVTDT